MAKDDRNKVDGYSRGELSQLARRRMLQQVKKNKTRYTRKSKHKED